MRIIRVLITLGTVFLLIPISLFAQLQRDAVPLKPWPAPLYWQPTEAESRISVQPPGTFGVVAADTRPANSLVFVGMTPCRVVDTRSGSGFTGAFGPPSLVGLGSRTFPIQSSATCSIPSIAQAYSFNVTIVPPGFLDFITVWPTGQPRPNASTLNGYVNTVIANAAIVPAGTSGSVDVFASQNTDLIIDVNGYYALQSGITLAQGNAGAPSLSFAGDTGTGIFSSAAGTLNITTAGTSRLTVGSNGEINSTGNFSISGNATVGGTLVANGNVGIGTGNPNGLQASSPVSDTAGGVDNVRFGVSLGTPRAIFEDDASSTQWEMDNFAGRFRLFTPGKERFTIDSAGSVGIGTGRHDGKLTVEGGDDIVGVAGNSSGIGVFGRGGAMGAGGSGVYGFSSEGFGVYGQSFSSFAGYFEGNVNITGTLTQNSDLRLKEGISNIGYGLPEVMRLRPVTWTWKQKPEQGVQLGLIAQEVETVLPELVATDKDVDHTKGLNYIGLVPVTIKAIQEQQAQIEDQQKHISELEARLAALENLLSPKSN
jgi:endosialidase-like protein